MPLSMARQPRGKLHKAWQSHVYKTNNGKLGIRKGHGKAFRAASLRLLGSYSA